MSITPTYKLIYFDLTGRGEAIRLAFRITNTPFTDERIPFPKWGAIKETFPLGTLPVLEVDGKRLVQSNAILSYVGKVTGLFPTDTFEGAKVDEFLGCVEDYGVSVFTPYRSAKEEDKPKVAEELLKTNIPKMLGYLENLVKNNGGETYAVGDKLTVADLKFFAPFHSAITKGFPFPMPGLLDNHPRLKKLYDAVHAAIPS